MESENPENGILQAIGYSLVIAAIAFASTWTYITDASIDDETRKTRYLHSAIITSVFFIVGLVIFISVLMPGDVVWPVTPADEAVKNVSATNLGIFGLISYTLYKLFGSKKAEKKEVAEETSAEAEVDELINSIE